MSTSVDFTEGKYQVLEAPALGIRTSACGVGALASCLSPMATRGAISHDRDGCASQEKPALTLRRRTRIRA